MPTSYKTAGSRTEQVRNTTLACFYVNNPGGKEGGNTVLTNNILTYRIVGQMQPGSCLDAECIPGVITEFICNNLQLPAPPYDVDYGILYNLIWNPVLGATSYRVISNFVNDLIIHASPLATSAEVYVPIAEVGTERIFTLSATTPCSNPTSSIEVFPCFLAGSLVHMADGTAKPIEEVCVGDFVLGAFGELNEVLALHRPLLGQATLCNINGEHISTNHHPHISVDGKFYCGDPAMVSNKTYGKMHKVIDADGNIVDRMLHGLKEERILKLSIGIELKTVEGHRVTRSLETFSMPEDTQLYNLVVGGSHTYHVDGYAVTGWPREDDFNYDTWAPL
jgi:hypothetical protein